MIRLLGALLICVATTSAVPARAEADFFRILAGNYGMPFSGTMECRNNPHHVGFFDDNRRVRIEWRDEIQGYDGIQTRSAEYSVVGTNALGIIMALDGESRLTEDGKPVVWVMRPSKGVDGYCWGRTDWPDMRCNYPSFRCPDMAPSS